MATRQALTLHQSNDETLLITITREQATDDLTTVATLELYLKDDACQSDADATLVLSSTDPTEITIDTQTAAQITATAHIPAAALAQAYDRFFRVDGLSGSGARRTAIYGPVTIIDL